MSAFVIEVLYSAEDGIIIDLYEEGKWFEFCHKWVL